jgi:hypothetical protein
MTPIDCRSPQQIHDDELVDTHNDIQRLLNKCVAGRCLYLGHRRERLKALAARIENEILTGESCTSVHLQHALYLCLTP